jgi:hypothetical protein
MFIPSAFEAHDPFLQKAIRKLYHLRLRKPRTIKITIVGNKRTEQAQKRQAKESVMTGQKIQLFVGYKSAWRKCKIIL